MNAPQSKATEDVVATNDQAANEPAFGLSVEQEELRSQFREVVIREIAPDLDMIRRDHEGEFSRVLWRRCADLGILRWAIPERFGGRGEDLISTVIMMEALGYGCRDNGLTFGLGAQVWGVQMALLHFGTDGQIAKYLPGLMNGELLAAYGMTEEASGSDAFSLKTTAIRDGDTFILNGEKVLITFAPIAEFAIVFAKTNPDAGRWGISAFLVDADTVGYRAHPVESKMGLRTVPFGRITLTDCRVPASGLLGKEGAGASIFGYSQGWERSLVLAPQIGAMERQLDDCVRLARTRKRGTTAIGKHQAIAHRVANMKLRLETARLLLYRTAWLQHRGRPNLMEAALTKIYLSETFAQSSFEAIAIHGGDGYKTATEVERDLRDAIGGTIYGGTSDIQRNIVAGLLGL